jgi:hypothetical protein
MELAPMLEELKQLAKGLKAFRQTLDKLPAIQVCWRAAVCVRDGEDVRCVSQLRCVSW